ncbi:phosphoenolpyruvate--protein phosphotransferase [candidate division KSB1 bacterium]|nr:phosphoenolpyruvate--protein phosphotransferase [candidate division KSB1 bacterium]
MPGKRAKYQGLAVSPGLAVGKACVFGKILVVPRRKIKVSQVERELQRLTDAIAESKQELSQLKSVAESEVGIKDAEIFGTHLLFLDDPVFLAKIQKKLVENKINLEAAVEDVTSESIRMFSKIHDPHFRERIQDIRDVGMRLLENIMGFDRSLLLSTDEDVIIVSSELTPSQTINLKKNRIRGFVTEKGGPTSHAAILARSLGIPLVSGVHNLETRLKMGSLLIVDGFRGEILQNPTEEELSTFRKQLESLHIQEDKEKKIAKLPTRTKDGVRIKVLANIRSEDDVTAAIHANADGIGLYRTEMHFLNHAEFPSEDEQLIDYRRVVEKIAPSPVTIRTLDLGGDKFSGFYPDLRETNPYLGLRAIRVSLEHPELFKMQLRAILRASVFGNVKLLLPMISGVEQVIKTKRLIRKCARELKRENLAFNAKIPVGAMIEVPSASLVIDSILKYADFLSVGTNDLIQYTIAVDRGNEMVSDLYEPVHPAILKLLSRMAKAARRANKSISICGEMAGDTRYTALLLGMGYTELSMSSFFIPHLKSKIHSLTMTEAKQTAQRVLALEKIKEIKKYINNSW